MKIISSSYWNQGKRSGNQDSLMIEQVNTRKGRVLLTAVSDGIGGLAEGETASGFILEKLLQNFYEQILPLTGRGKGKKVLERSLMRCLFNTNEMLKKYAENRKIALGATVSVLLIFRKNFVAVHLGDSRIYRIYGNHKIKQITRDHSAGKNILTKCIGSFPYQSPQIIRGRIRSREGFLLCSDGFYHYLNKEVLAELLHPKEISCEEQIEKRLKELAEYGLKKGEQDNMSALYVRCGRQKG